MIIGWSMIPPKKSFWDNRGLTPQDWQVFLVGGDRRIDTLGWRSLRDDLSLEEWEALEAERV